MWLGNQQSTKTCPCGSKFDKQNNMNYKKGGFISIRHDLRDLTAMMSEACKVTKIEPKLTPLSGE